MAFSNKDITVIENLGQCLGTAKGTWSHEVQDSEIKQLALSIDRGT